MISKIVDSTWFNNIGIVIIETQPMKKLKAYIGNGDGYDQEMDEQKISKFGSPFPIEVAKMLIGVN